MEEHKLDFWYLVPKTLKNNILKVPGSPRCASSEIQDGVQNGRHLGSELKLIISQNPLILGHMFVLGTNMNTHPKYHQKKFQGRMTSLCDVTAILSHFFTNFSKSTSVRLILYRTYWHLKNICGITKIYDIFRTNWRWNQAATSNSYRFIDFWNLVSQIYLVFRILRKCQISRNLFIFNDMFVWETYINVYPRNHLEKFQGHMTSSCDVTANFSRF